MDAIVLLEQLTTGAGNIVEEAFLVLVVEVNCHTGVTLGTLMNAGERIGYTRLYHAIESVAVREYC